MDLQIKDQLFIVGGATAGFGHAVATALINEGAKIIAVARGKDKLELLRSSSPAQVEILAGDISQDSTLQEIITMIGGRQVHGMLVNAGGPPAKTVMETSLADWDDAYQKILRWKIQLTQAIVARMLPHQYGRIVFIESSSVKQPLENLVLSTSFRLAVVGMAKTLSQEIAASGVTLNIIGPGSHNTAAIDRIYHKKSEQTGKPFEEVKKAAIQQIPVGTLGEASDLASLALWLLSPLSRYVTGQTMLVDGGVVKGLF